MRRIIGVGLEPRGRGGGEVAEGVDFAYARVFVACVRRWAGGRQKWRVYQWIYHSIKEATVPLGHKRSHHSLRGDGGFENPVQAGNGPSIVEDLTTVDGIAAWIDHVY